MKAKDIFGNRIKRRMAAGMLVFTLGVQSVAGIMPWVENDRSAEAAMASYQEDEYSSEISDYIEAEMNMQLSTEQFLRMHIKRSERPSQSLEPPSRIAGILSISALS